MDYRALLDRIYQSVDSQAYFTPTYSVPPEQRLALQEVAEALRAPDFDADAVRALARRLHARGRLDRVRLLSALHVIEAHPRVANWAEAARLAGEQELAALDLGGPDLQHNLAAVERHRGVLAFLRNQYEVALDYFSRALERERSAENLQNVLCSLLRLGEEDDARNLLAMIRRSYPDAIVHQLNQSIRRDPDLALLREDDTP
jgi:tetratricopeptide (TPR) repeat protein